MLCCAKKRRCELFRVTSSLDSRTRATVRTRLNSKLFRAHSQKIYTSRKLHCTFCQQKSKRYALYFNEGDVALCRSQNGEPVVKWRSCWFNVRALLSIEEIYWVLVFVLVLESRSSPFRVSQDTYWEKPREAFRKIQASPRSLNTTTKRCARHWHQQETFQRLL